MNSFRLQNTDLRWYRDKYLLGVFIVCVLGAMSLLWAWPPPHSDLIRGAKFLGVAVACVLASPQRLIILASGVLFVFIRGLVGLVLYHSFAALGVSAVCAAVLYYLFAKKEGSLRPAYPLKDYSYAELVIDCAVFGSLLWFYVRFIR
jgi:hypothetical protein